MAADPLASFTPRVREWFERSFERPTAAQAQAWPAIAAGAEEISTEMKLAAAHAIAAVTKESELVPDALDPEVHERVAAAVLDCARDQGVSRPERVPAGL